MEEVEKLSPREIANSIVDDVRLRLVAPKPAYDSVDLGERLIAAALQRLQGERDHFAAYKARWEAKAEEFAGRAEAAEARGEALRKALEPFARAYATTEHDGGSFLPMVKKVSLQDFAAAKAVITAAALSDLAALDADLIVGPTAKAEESAVYPQRDMASAPRDGTPILAVVGVASERWEHLNGRSFVIRHEGKTASGYDLGWSVYPGLGGVSDDWFACWTPLPAPAEARSDPLDTPLPCDVEVAHIRFRKGVALRTFVNAARRWHAKASAAEKTDPEKLAEFKAWFERKVEIEGNDLVSVGVGLAGPDLCAHDGRPCYVSAGTDDAHWRCGTSACPGSQSVGSAILTRDA